MEDGTSLTVKANVQQLTDGLESGKAYTFNVTVGKNGATINSVTVGDWGTDGWTESGTADTAISFSIQTSTDGLTPDDGEYILAD